MALPNKKIAEIFNEGFSLVGRADRRGEQVAWLTKTMTDMLPANTDSAVYSMLLESLLATWPISGMDQMRAGPEITKATVQLLSLGADPLYNADTLTNKKTTSLVVAGKQSVTPSTSRTCILSHIISAGNTEAFKFAMEKIKSGPNAAENIDLLNRLVDSTGVPVLCFVAADKDRGLKHTKLLPLMLETGWDTEVKDEDGNTPLHLAKDRETVRLLLNHGANAQSKNNAGILPWKSWSETESVSTSTLKGMVAELKSCLKLKSGSRGLPPELTGSQEATWFKSAMSGIKTGLPTNSKKLMSGTKSVPGFDTPVNLLEAGLLAIILGQGHSSSYKINASAVNHIIKQDKDDALWTDRACMMGILAIGDSKVSAPKMFIADSHRKKLGVMVESVLSSLMDKNLVLSSALPRSEPYGPGFVKNIGADWPFVLDHKAWGCFWSMLVSVLENDMTAAFDEDNAYARQTSDVNALTLEKVAQRIPPEAYEGFYAAVSRLGDISFKLASELNTFVLQFLKESPYSSKEERARISSSPERADAFLRASLSVCCPQKKSGSVSQSAGGVRSKVYSNAIKSIIKAAVKSVMAAPNAEERLAALTEKTKSIRVQHNAWVKTSDGSAPRAVQHTARDEPDVKISNLVLDAMEAGLIKAARQHHVDRKTNAAAESSQSRKKRLRSGSRL